MPAALRPAVDTLDAIGDGICRLCDPVVCGHPARCPVTAAAVAAGA